MRSLVWTFASDCHCSGLCSSWLGGGEEHGAVALKDISRKCPDLLEPIGPACSVGYCPLPLTMSVVKDSRAPRSLLQPSPAALAPQQVALGSCPLLAPTQNPRGYRDPCRLIKSRRISVTTANVNSTATACSGKPSPVLGGWASCSGFNGHSSCSHPPSHRDPGPLGLRRHLLWPYSRDLANPMKQAKPICA